MGNQWNERELFYFEGIACMTAERGNEEQLSIIYKSALEEHNEGLISQEAIGRMYALCMEYSQPR